MPDLSLTLDDEETDSSSPVKHTKTKESTGTFKTAQAISHLPPAPVGGYTSNTVLVWSASRSAYSWIEKFPYTVEWPWAAAAPPHPCLRPQKLVEAFLVNQRQNALN